MTMPLSGSDLFKYNNIPTTPAGNPLGNILNLLYALDSSVDRVAEPGTSGEALAIGQVVTFNDAGGSSRVFKSDADHAAPLRRRVTGICVVAAAGAGLSVAVVTNGKVAIPDAFWDVVPTAADVGSPVYVSLIAGNSTLTAPPLVAPNWIQRVGILRDGGPGNCAISVQQGEGTQF
jgi:hypothetical protein